MKIPRLFDLEPIPKIDRHIACDFLIISVAYSKVKCLPTVKKIPDELWDEIRLILPPEKPTNTIGRPAISFRKILDGIVYVLRTRCQ